MDDATSATDDASAATSPVVEVLYGTAEDAPVDGLMAAFDKLLADAGTVGLALRDTTIVAGTDDDQQVAVAFDVVVGEEPPFERAESVALMDFSESPADTDDIDLVPELQEATEAVVTFHPQIWKDDYAVTGTNTETYTLPIKDVVMSDGTLPDDSVAPEPLARHADAPERARNWQGPFFVTVDEVR
jgi:hypothetical protein